MSLTNLTASLVSIGILSFGILGVVEAEPPQALSHPDAEKSRLATDRFGDPLPPGAIRRFGTLRFRHNGSEEFAFTPDGKHLIGAGRSKPLVVFDAETGRKLHELGTNNPQYRDLRGLAISPDGKRVARCGPHVIFVWELQTGRLIRQLYWQQGQEAVFSPDGTKVAALRESYKGRGEYQTSVVVLEAAAETPPLKIVAEKTIKEGKQQTYGFDGIAFSPDGKYLAGRYSELYNENPFVIGVSSSQVWLLDAATAARVRTFGSAGVSVVCFAFQPGSSRLATYGKDGAIRFWDVATGKEVRRIQAAKEGEEYSYSQLRFSADGSRCAVVTDGARFLTVLDAKDGRVIRRIAIEENKLKVVLALSADGKSIASASPYEESCVRVWDIASGSERFADAGHRAAATSLSLSADGRTLTSRDEKGRQFQWDTETGKGEIRPTNRREEIGQVIWSRDLGQRTLRGPRWQMVYKNQQPAIVEIRSLDGSKLIRKLEIDSPPVSNVALSPDGAQLAIANQTIKGANSIMMVWDPEREEQPRKLPGSPGYCRELLFSHDGKRLIGASRVNVGNAGTAGALWVWDTAQARLVHKLAADDFPSHLLLTANDGVLLAGIGWKSATIRAWDMDTGKELAEFTDPNVKPATGQNNPQLHPAITGLALSHDERFVAVVSSWEDFSALSVWEAGSWKLVRAFAPTSPPNNVKAMVFSRDGRSLFVANSDTTILEWDVSGRGAKQPAGEALNRDRLNVLWRTLAETPDKAYPAVWEMLDHPAESVPFLLDKVSPIKLAEEKRVRQLIAQLDSDSFAQREEASRQLLALGEQILPMLRQAWNDPPSLEVKKRLGRILESLPRIPTADHLRLLRALAVLEWSNRPEAVEHLRRLAGGAPSASLTLAAEAAWRRCQEKMVGGPKSGGTK